MRVHQSERLVGLRVSARAEVSIESFDLYSPVCEGGLPGEEGDDDEGLEDVLVDGHPAEGLDQLLIPLQGLGSEQPMYGTWKEIGKKSMEIGKN